MRFIHKIIPLIPNPLVRIPKVMIPKVLNSKVLNSKVLISKVLNPLVLIFLVLIFLVLIPLMVISCNSPDAEISDINDPDEASVDENEYIPPDDPTEGLELGDPVLGREYFLGENRGKCLDCHTLDGVGNNRSYDVEGNKRGYDVEGNKRGYDVEGNKRGYDVEGNNRSYDWDVWALDDTGLRREPEWLAIFIDNPRNLRPEVARMPPFRGDSDGAAIADVVAFLMTLRKPVEHPESTDIKPDDEPDPNFDGIGGFTGHNQGGY